MLQPSATDLTLSDMSDAKRALLQKYLSGAVAFAPPESRVIARRAANEPALPSLGQEQLWIHSQLVTDLTIYNEPVTVRRTGPLDVPALQQSLNEIIRRHEAWRTNFAVQNGQLVQVIKTRVDDLNQLTVLHGKVRTPGFVAANYLVEALLQRRHVKWTGPAHGHRLVVDGQVGYELAVDPKLFLSERWQRRFICGASRNDSGFRRGKRDGPAQIFLQQRALGVRH